jgi:hypothetical protein
VPGIGFGVVEGGEITQDGVEVDAAVEREFGFQVGGELGSYGEGRVGRKVTPLGVFLEQF